MIVHATDDDFGEAPAIQSGQAVKHDYAETAAALRRAEVRMFSFAARVGGQCECLDVRPGLYTRFHGRPRCPTPPAAPCSTSTRSPAASSASRPRSAGRSRAACAARYPLSPFGSEPPQ
jgi:hypothetical protein